MSSNTFSVLGLAGWLETQDPATEYPYTSNDDCLICRYFRDRGVALNAHRPVYPFVWTDTDGKDHALPAGLNDIAKNFPHTYGAALARAHARIETA